MPPERAKQLFEGLREAVDNAAEKASLEGRENAKRIVKAGMAKGLPLKEKPELDYLREWEQKKGS